MAGSPTGSSYEPVLVTLNIGRKVHIAGSSVDGELRPMRLPSRNSRIERYDRLPPSLRCAAAARATDDQSVIERYQ